MIKVEGYKAFHGVMMITPKAAEIKPFKLEADWLYKPDTMCWYGKGSSFNEGICQVIAETPKEVCKHNFIEKQVEKNASVYVLECADCGEVSVRWYREE